MICCSKTFSISSSKKCFVTPLTEAEISLVQKKKQERKILPEHVPSTSRRYREDTSSSDDSGDEPPSKRRKERDRLKFNAKIWIAEVENFNSGFLIKNKFVIRDQSEFFFLFTSFDRYRRCETNESIYQLPYENQPQVYGFAME